MKNLIAILCTAVLCAMVDSVQCQTWESGTDGALYYTGGRVGIGTSSLSSILIYNGTHYNLSSGEGNLLVLNTHSGAEYSNSLIVRRSGIGGTYTHGILFADGNSMQAAIRASRVNSSSNYQSNLDFYTHGSTHTSFADDSDIRMRITPVGKVGIGTTNPVAKLHIFNNATTGNWGTFNGANAGLKIVDNSASFYIDGNSIYCDGNLMNLGTISSHYLSLGTNSLERIRIESNGNVGIGTTDPDYKLDVAGNMRSTEVKVEAPWWPDYVFFDKYELLSLEETADYISENGHLPEIPSAAEVAENGINLGEMNALLLKKIEELTLHLIEQNKRIEELEKESNEHQD